MSKEVAKTTGWWDDPGTVELIKRKIIKLWKKNVPADAEEQVAEFVYFAKTVELNPLLNQIYAIPRSGKLTYQTSIDGLRAIAHRTGECTGITRKPIYADDKLIGAWAVAKRNGHEFCTTVRFNEYSEKPYDGSVNLWTQKPETMIIKVAEAHALRMAFPEQMASIYTDDELSMPINITPQAQQIESTPAKPINVTPSKEKPKPTKKPNQVPAIDVPAFDLNAISEAIEFACEANDSAGVKIILDKVKNNHPDKHSEIQTFARAQWKVHNPPENGETS